MEARTMLPKWLTAMLVLLHEAWSARRDALTGIIAGS
jgi:hypothetical protein